MSDLKLNKEQRVAIEYGKGPLLIVAGAGTGKTTVLTQRVFNLLKKKDINSDNVLALTFTEKAANEMESRIERALPFGYADLWVMTFHSFAQKILEDYGIDIGLPSSFRVLDEVGSWTLVRKNLDKFELDYYQPLGNPTKFIRDMLRHFSRCKDELINPQDYLKYAEKLKINKGGRATEDYIFETKRLEEMANAYHVYQQLLLDNEVLDFGDLIFYCLKLFKERPNVLKKYQEQFKYILIDEFQDTNYAQYQLIRLLAEPKNNLTVVADDDQSIYAFRGSSMNNILGFKKDYPQAHEVFLNQNYRSTQNILDLSYNFIQQNNPERLEIKLSKGKSPQLKGKCGDKQKLSKKLQACSDDQGEIEVLKARDEKDEVREVIKKIHSILKKEKDLSWNDFAILVRANAHAKPFTIGLQEANIPYQFVASRGLYEKEIVLDIIAYLKLLDNYHESSAVWRVLNFSFWKLPAKEIINFSHMARKKAISIYAVIKNINYYLKVDEKTQKTLNNIVNLVEKHTRLALNKNVWVVIWNFLNDSGYLKYIDTLPELEKQEIFSYLGQFYKRIQSFEKDNDSTKVRDFIEFFNLEIESGERGKLNSEVDEGPETVKIMTVHGAKGLEFKYVFIIGLVDKRFPSISRREKIEIPNKLVKEILPEGDIHLQEERRLFYVAMTRAKKGLYFTWASDYGGARLKKPSKFLQELNLIKLEEDLKTEKKVFNKEDLEIKDIKVKSAITKADLKKLIPQQYSFTQIRAYQSCPRQYYYSHILKIPLQGKAVFSYGKTMHLTMQRFFQLILNRSQQTQADLFDTSISEKSTTNKLGVSLEELLKIYEESWINDWFDDQGSKKKYKDQGRKSLREFYKKLEKKLPNVKFLEKGFNLKVGSYSFKGEIDRVDILDGGVQIVDYKTGHSKEKLSIDDKQQLLIYQIAYESIFKEKVKNLKFYYLNDNTEVDFLGNQKDLTRVTDKLIDTIQKINSCDFTAQPNDFICKYCDFKGICPFKA
ncbi:ATP-dependent helicase [bacterium]|nr:ATP-dependent helicase [bacterium]